MTKTKKPGITYNASGVSHRDETGTYEVIGEMTPSMTQDTLAEKYGIEIPSMPLIWAIATRGYELRDENPQESESLRQFIGQGFRRWPNTSTRLRYNPTEKDEIIHNYKTPDQYSLDEKLVGLDGWINEIPDKNVLESLLGTSNIEQINKVSQWINGTNVSLCKFNSKPDKRVESVARFDAGGGGLILNCLGDLLDECPAFRVLKLD